MPRAKKGRSSGKSSGKAGGVQVRIDLQSAPQFVHLSAVYKAGLLSYMATGVEIWRWDDVDHYVEEYNSFIASVFERRGRRRADIQSLLLESRDFGALESFSQSSGLLESKEFIHLDGRFFYKEARKVFGIARAVLKVADAFDGFTRVRIGERWYHVFVDVEDRTAAGDLWGVNERVWRRASNLGGLALLLYAASLVVLKLGGVSGRLFVGGGSYYTATALPVEALSRMRRVARFFVELVESGSDYVEPAASAIWSAISLSEVYGEGGGRWRVAEDWGRLYQVARSMLASRWLSEGERRALDALFGYA
ncbi:hypothetical protein Tneu_0996 [Pyrobaculum neutrophilum V24Sta]|uniref:Uncharacterized protein n=2 Tax=Pyrobaculum neutrophilum TaxID=70771 RepID=B1YDR5_PYRNV|nr:hypothetical protein Tneu_0996 [Pyrobaculum neutrophilum V24Sta]